jgi:hypothetical protein
MFNLKKFRKVGQMEKYIFIGFQDLSNNKVIALFNASNKSTVALSEFKTNPEMISNYEEYERGKNHQIFLGKKIKYKDEQNDL